jgi:pyruvate dehydrogenase E1 component beta subunit
MGVERRDMRNLTLLQAIKEAMSQEMNRDESVFLIGEDLRIGGGFGVSRGLVARFGKERVLDTPISETGFVGAAIGAAVMGMRPIAEFQFGDFVFCAMDQIVNEAAKLHYMSGGQVSVPLVLRLPIGANRRAAQHSQCSESIFMNVPGLKIVVPSTPYDAKGLMISAIRDNNPVLFFEHKLIYAKKTLPGEEESTAHQVPEEEYEVPFGSAEVRRKGLDITVVATHLMLYRAIETAEELKKEGIEIEVIDPRTLVPLDTDTIVQSVGKTRKLLVVHESPLTGGWAGEIVSCVAESLEHECRMRRVAVPDTPIPYAPALEDYVVPGKDRIKDEIRSMLG